MLWQRRQVLWLPNTHITAGGGGFTGSLIMTKLLNNKQELAPRPPFPHPCSNLRFLQGKSMTMGKYKMSSLKQLQPWEWHVLWLMLTPSTPTLPWQHEQLNQETQYGQRLINEETQSTGEYCQRGRSHRVWPMEKTLAWRGSCWQNRLRELERTHEWEVEGLLSLPLVERICCSSQNRTVSDSSEGLAPQAEHWSLAQCQLEQKTFQAKPHFCMHWRRFLHFYLFWESGQL